MAHARLAPLALALGIAACAAPPGPAPSPHPDEGKPVRAIRLEGSSSTERIMGALGTRIGDPLTASVLAEDLRRLSNRRVVVRLVRTEDSGDGGVVVTFVVQEPS